MQTVNIIAHEIASILELIDTIWDSLPKLPPVDSMLALSEKPIFLKRTHRHSLLFASEPIDLLISICGLDTTIPVALRIGWNDLTFPPETTISLASGELSAIHRCVDTLR